MLSHTRRSGKMLRVGALSVRGALVVASALVVLGVSAAPALAGAPETPEVSVEAHSPSPQFPASEAVLHGVLNPNAEGVPGEYQFLYKASSAGECEGGAVAPASPGLAFGFQHEEPAETIKGLTPGTEYAVCLLAITSPTEETLSAAVTFTTAVTPPAPETLSPARLITATTASLEGVLNPHATAKAGWYFEYSLGASCTGGQTTEVEVEATVEDETVAKEVTELQPNAQYTFCLVATNEAGEATASPTEVHFKTLTETPTLESLATPSLTSTAATLEAVVNPENEPTTSCVFDFGETTAYGQELPCEPASIHGFGGQGLSAAVSGLTRDSAYYYRVRVSTSIGEMQASGKFVTSSAVAGPPQSNCANPGHTGLSGPLPDCRAYELVTPVDKQDAKDLFGDFGATSIQEGSFDVGFTDEGPEEGDKFLLSTSAAFGPFAAAGQNGYIFSRGPSGWQETSLASHTPGAQSVGTGSIVSPDFSNVAAFDQFGSKGNVHAVTEVGFVGPPLASEAPGPYAATVFDSAIGKGSMFVGASSNFSKVFFQSREHGFAAPAQEQLAGSHALYEYSGGHYSLVNVNSEGKLLNTCGAVSPATEVESIGAYSHAVSADGSRVFFLSPDPEDSTCYEETLSGFTGTPPQLYVRSEGQTIEVSEPEKGIKPDPDGPQPVAFAGASADGSRVFFITRGELTADDAGNHDPELYEYDLQTAKLTRISSGDTHSAEGDVGWVVPSEDGSTVYFTATGSLAPGAHTLGAGGETTEYNLYRYDTETAATTYIATVSGNDWYNKLAFGAELLNIRNPLNFRSNWETTPNGQYLLFAAVENLSGYNPHDPTGHCEGNVGGLGGNGNCAEVYRYDAASGSLVCVSCNPSGAAPSANAEFDRSTIARQVRAISDDGAYVFFDTTEPLVPTATNEHLNVYEWHEGEISLISSGQDASNSYFLGTDPSGADVFFGTHARLVPQDTDSAGDLYDARIGGGFPVAQGSAACEGDACQSPPPLPLFQTPATLTETSSGNFATGSLAPSTAPKKTSTKKAGKVKCRTVSRKGKKKRICVKQARAKKANAKHSSKDRGAHR
jgi:hypothetical protein